MKCKALTILFWLSPIAAILLMAIAIFAKKEAAWTIVPIFVLTYFICYLIIASFVLNRKWFFLQMLYMLVASFTVVNAITFLYMLSVSDDWKTEYIAKGWAAISGTILLVFALIHFIRLKLIPYYKEKHKLKES
jgi:hypothetical protein